MALSYLQNINLNGNQIQNAVIQPLAAEPTTLLSAGRIFFDTAENRTKTYRGASLGWGLAAYMSDIDALKTSISSTYAKASDLTALRMDFDALYKLLNTDDADGVINTWNEVVDFLNEYKDSEDLATILSGLESKITGNTTSITTLQGYFSSGIANQAAKVTSALTVKFNGITYTYDGSAAGTVDITDEALVSALGNTPVNSATADASGNVITTTYATIEGLTSATGRISALETWYNKVKDYFAVDENGDLYTDYNFYSTKQIAAGGGGEEGGGTGGGVILDYDSIVDALGYTPANDADLTSAVTRIEELEGKATAVTFTPTVTSGTALGTFTIDGTDKVIYAPSIPESIKNPNALTFGSKSYDGSAAVTLTASDLGALTTHQTIYALTVKNSAGTAVLTYMPNSAKGELTLTKAMVGLDNVENTALSTWAGTLKITTVGTITTGTWNGTKIANAYLANSSVTIAGKTVSLGSALAKSDLLTALGLNTVTKKYAGAITAGTATEYTITHDLGTRDVVVLVYDPSTYEQVMVDVMMSTTAAVKIGFASAPSKNYRVVVVG